MEANIRSIVEDTELGASLLHDARLTIDALEQILIDEELEIARRRGVQIADLELIDQAQVATADGARNLSEWVAGRLDVGTSTARDLVRTMRRTEHRPDLRSALAEGSATFDRVEAASRIVDSQPDHLFLHLDVKGLRREAANRVRTTAEQEAHNFLDQHLVMQPTLDESWWNVWGGLDGVIGAIVDQAIAKEADQLPIGPEAPNDSAWRRAMGLAQLCLRDEPAPTQISVFVDAGVAAPTDGEAGVYLEAGPRVGPNALEAVMCNAVTEVTVSGDDGEPMRYGRRSRTIPPALRRAIIRRVGNRCVIDGCDSRNRLQVHHIIPWSRGGPTDPSNLLTVCWYHHHIAIHRQGLTPCRHPEHGRWRLRRLDPSRSPPG